jgi:hypothetical protein
MEQFCGSTEEGNEVMRYVYKTGVKYKNSPLSVGL